MQLVITKKTYKAPAELPVKTQKVELVAPLHSILYTPQKTKPLAKETGTKHRLPTNKRSKDTQISRQQKSNALVLLYRKRCTEFSKIFPPFKSKK